MKSLYSLFFAFLFIAFQPLSKIWIIVSFKINQEYIAKTLCIQKEIENNTCQGHCQLKKQLEKSENQEQNATTTKIKIKIEEWVCRTPQNDWNFITPHSLILTQRYILYSNSFFPASYISDIFHPPQFHLI